MACKAAEASRSGVATFCKELRNYIQHRSLPTPTAVADVKYVGSSPFSSIELLALDSERLLDWDGWSKRSREFVGQFGEVVQLGPVIEAHAELLTDLHRTIFREVSSESEAQFKPIRQLSRQLARLSGWED